jgi:archaellum component FlaC
MGTLEDKLDHFKNELSNLKKLPRFKEISNAIKRLEKEIAKIERVLTLDKSKSNVSPVNTDFAKKSRTEKISKGLKKYNHYLRMIRDNFPDLSWGELRKQYSNRRHGHDTNIPEAIWQNPSPSPD